MDNKKEEKTNLVPFQALGVTVIADDLTGAAEIGGVCLRYGMKVSFGIDSVPCDNSDVRIIATDSRSETETDAYRIHHDIAIELYKDSNPLVFKKCDSVLRGFILTELSAILEVSRKKKVLLQPANPVAGRCIKAGLYYIGKEKIQDTGFSDDPDFPATGSMIQNMLFQRSKRHEIINEVHIGLIKNINGSGVFVPDCSSVDELKSCSELSDDKTLLCGSAAFFEQILLKKGLNAVNQEMTQAVFSTDCLLVSGSTHTESRRFVQKMRDENYPVVAFPPVFLQETVENSLMYEWIDKLAVDWKKERKLILTVSDKNITFTNSSTVLKQRLIQIIQKLLEQCKVGELFIEGGATTYSLLRTLDWKTLMPVEELAPGVVRMRVPDSPVYLTLKPGSYPWPEII